MILLVYRIKEGRVRLADVEDDEAFKWAPCLNVARRRAAVHLA